MIEIFLIIFTLGMVVLGIMGDTWNSATKCFTKFGWGVLICGVLFSAGTIFQTCKNQSEANYREEQKDKLTVAAYSSLDYAVRNRIRIFETIFWEIKSRFNLPYSYDSSVFRNYSDLTSDLYMQYFDSLTLDELVIHGRYSTHIYEDIVENTNTFNNDLKDLRNVFNFYYDAETQELMDLLLRHTIFPDSQLLYLKRFDSIKVYPLSDFILPTTGVKDYYYNYMLRLKKLSEIAAAKVKSDSN